jgi:hypothetical protein
VKERNMRRILCTMLALALVGFLALPVFGATSADDSEDGVIYLTGLDTNWNYSRAIRITAIVVDFARTAGKYTKLRLGSATGPALPFYSVDGGPNVFYPPTRSHHVPYYVAADSDLAAGSAIIIYYDKP